MFSCKKDIRIDMLDFYSDPIYLPDNKLLFTVELKEKRYLIKYNREKGEYIILHKDMDKILYPQYSYELKKITFTATFDNDNYSEIFIMDESGDNLKQLTNNKTYNTLPIFVPNSKKIIFRKANMENHMNNFYIMDINGKNEKLLFEKEYRNTSRPSISPDGNLIAFTEFIGKFNTPERIANFIVCDIKNNKINILLENIKVATPKFLDNENIIYSGYSGKYYDNGGGPGLFKLNINTKKLELLQSTIISEGGAIDISYDKKKVMFLDYVNDIYEYDIENKFSERIFIDSDKIYELIQKGGINKNE